MALRAKLDQLLRVDQDWMKAIDLSKEKANWGAIGRVVAKSLTLIPLVYTVAYKATHKKGSSGKAGEIARKSQIQPETPKLACHPVNREAYRTMKDPSVEKTALEEVDRLYEEHPTNFQVYREGVIIRRNDARKIALVLTHMVPANHEQLDQLNALKDQLKKLTDETDGIATPLHPNDSRTEKDWKAISQGTRALLEACEKFMEQLEITERPPALPTRSNLPLPLPPTRKAPPVPQEQVDEQKDDSLSSTTSTTPVDDQQKAKDSLKTSETASSAETAEPFYFTGDNEASLRNFLSADTQATLMDKIDAALKNKDLNPVIDYTKKVLVYFDKARPHCSDAQKRELDAVIKTWMRLDDQRLDQLLFNFLDSSEDGQSYREDFVNLVNRLHMLIPLKDS